MSQAGPLNGGGGGGGSGNVKTLTGNSGGAVPPNGSGNINVIGSGIITVTGNPGTNTLTITSSGSTAFDWQDEAVSFNASPSNGYFIIGNLTATLPGAPSIGDTIEFFVDGAFTLTIQANTGQTINFAGQVSSSAGTFVNTASGDACTLVYRSTNTRWEATSFVGGWNHT